MGGGGKLKSSFKTSPAFTLAEVLITLAIIGVVAAMTIPAVIVNTNQAEFKTGLRKAVSVLNSAITLNKALTGESPYDNGDLYNYLQQHMAVMKSHVITICGDFSDDGGVKGSPGGGNFAFYTADGMRYEFPTNTTVHKLHESDITLQGSVSPIESLRTRDVSEGCGSNGLSNNPDGTSAAPCLVMVDVNGDRKPNGIYNTYERNGTYQGWENYYVCGNSGNKDERRKFPKPQDRLLSDIFSIMITDQGAIPYGVVAQKAMYQAQK